VAAPRGNLPCNAAAHQHRATLLPHVAISKQSDKPPVAWLVQVAQLRILEEYMVLVHNLALRLEIHLSLTLQNCLLSLLGHWLGVVTVVDLLQSQRSFVFRVSSLRLADECFN